MSLYQIFFVLIFFSLSLYTWHPCWPIFGPSQLQVQLFSNLSDQPMLCCKRSLLPWWCIQCTSYLILFATLLTLKHAEGQELGWYVEDGKDPLGSHSACQHQRCWMPCYSKIIVIMKRHWMQNKFKYELPAQPAFLLTSQSWKFVEIM